LYPLRVNRTIIEQLRGAYERSNWTMDELLERSGLEIDRSTLRRKLLVDKNSKTDRNVPMRTDEAEALAHALGVTLVVLPEDEDKPS
jgi:hypothetical protein